MNTKINEAQAQLLLDWMATAAVDAADDAQEMETWRIHRFRQQAKKLMEEFNQAAE